MLLTHSRFLLIINFEVVFNARKSIHEYVHSLRIELAKLIVVGKRLTYQATGDAGVAVKNNHANFRFSLSRKPWRRSFEAKLFHLQLVF